MRTRRRYLLDGRSGHRAIIPRAIQPREIPRPVADVPCWRPSTRRSCTYINGWKGNLEFAIVKRSESIPFYQQLSLRLTHSLTLSNRSILD